jgi:hypothetical protein
MSIKQIIASAGRNRHTIILTAREKDGSIQTREAEPYSYRNEKSREYSYCYDVHKEVPANSLPRALLLLKKPGIPLCRGGL